MSKLTIRSKLAAALAVPLIALAAVVAVQVRDSVGETDDARTQADLATSATGPGGIVTALQNERNLQGARAIGADKQVDLPVKTAPEATAATDKAITDFRKGLDDLDPKAAEAYLPALSAIEAGIGDIRERADALGSAPSLDPAHQAAANEVFSQYSALLAELLDANARVPLTIADASLRTGVELLDAMSRQSEVESLAVRAALISGTLKDKDAITQTPILVGQRQAAENRVRNLAIGPYEKPVLSVLDNPERVPYVTAIDGAASNPAATELNALLASTPKSDAAQMPSAQKAVAKIVDERATLLRDDATTKQRNYMLVAFGAVALALFVLALANRWITKPLSKLADEARVMASERLPNAVNTILETPPGEDVVPPTIEPIHVRGGSEVAGAVEALNAVQESAVGLAVEQVVLRRNIADSFVNLGRRNQNLLSRQLDLITQLEQEESDAEELEQLFRLDHLATRMRRNAESLLVLAGEEPARQWSAPVPVGDVLRAALGEVEQYSRVRLQNMDETTVVGRAVADVSHIVAELVENALAFSPPDSNVKVYGQHSDEGYQVTIVDSGIGMSEDDLERANVRLRGAESFTVAPSRYLGHYVVAQLAKRHSIHVELQPGPDSGVVAVIVLPFALLDDGLGGPISEMPDVDTFSFGDISFDDAAPSGPPPFDGDADESEPVAEEPVAAAPVDVTAEIDAPVIGESDPGTESDRADIDVPSFLAGFGASASTMTPPATEESFESSDEESFAPWSVADATPSSPPADHVPLTNFFAEAAAAVGAQHPSEVEAEVEAEVVDDEAPVEEPAPVTAVNKSAFSAMLHATNTSTVPPASTDPVAEEQLVEPAPPQPEPVQAFVQGGPATEHEPVSAAGDVTFVATAIQDDLLPQLPRRGRRRGADQTAPAVPAVPAQVLRIAAAQTDNEAVAEAPAAVVVDEPIAASPGAPPLPRRELDSEPVAPPRVESAPAPATAESTRPNYELFAAFRAATDQGRADAVRRGDGGGA
jgi:signal transduction histidine kinase